MYGPIELRLHNCRPFRGDHVLPLPRRGLVLISGPSGVGKTALLQALAEAFQQSAYTAQDWQCWYDDTPWGIELDLYTDEGPYTVTRGPRVTRLDHRGGVFKGGTGTILGAAATKDYLQETLGIDLGLLMELTYRRQGERGIFLSRTDADKKELLTQLIPELVRIEAAAVEAQQKATQLGLRVRDAETTEKALRAELDRAVQALKDCREPLYTSAQEIAVARTCAGVQGAEKRVFEAQHGLDMAQRVVESEHVDLNKFLADCLAPQFARATALNADLKSLRPDLTEAKALESDLEVAEDLLAEIQAEDAARLKDLRDTQTFLQRTLEDVGARVATLPNLREAALQFRAQIKGLEARRCFTCNQVWADADASLRLGVARADLGRTEATIAGLEPMVGQLQALRAELQAIDLSPGVAVAVQRDHVQDFRSRLDASRRRAEDALVSTRAQIRLELAQVDARASGLRHDYDLAVARSHDSLIPQKEALELARRDLETTRFAFTQAERDLEAVQAQNRIMATTTEAFRKALQDAQERLRASQDALAGVRAAEALENDVAAVLGREGFLGAIFDEVLAEISRGTNEALQRIPNVARVVLGFRTEWATARGVQRRTIVPVLNINGQDTTLKAGPSGGMTEALYLCSDLALARVGSQRTGSFPGWLLLDEPFNGMRTADREGALEVLRDHARDRLVVVIDHHDETLGLYDQVVEVVSENGLSSLKIHKEAT